MNADQTNRKVKGKSQRNELEEHEIKILGLIKTNTVLQNYVVNAPIYMRHCLLSAIMAMLKQVSKLNLMYDLVYSMDDKGPMYQDTTPPWATRIWRHLLPWCKAELHVATRWVPEEFEDVLPRPPLPPTKKVKREGSSPVDVDAEASDSTATPPRPHMAYEPLEKTQQEGGEV